MAVPSGASVVSSARRTLLFALLSLALAIDDGFGCATTAIESRRPLPVPPGLSDQDEQSAILLALGEPRPAGAGGPEANRAAVPQASWFPGSVAPGIVVASFQDRSHHLQLTTSYDAVHVSTKITASKNLSASSTRIRDAAFMWTDQLHSAIRQGVGQLAVRKARDAQRRRRRSAARPGWRKGVAGRRAKPQVGRGGDGAERELVITVPFLPADAPTDGGSRRPRDWSDLQRAATC